MPRAERLLELADLLRRTDATTVAALAGELDVSGRTILRDLAALRDRGMPITADAGRGGGVRLDRDRAGVPVDLSVHEIAGMWLAATLSRQASILPWGDAASAGLARLLSTLPPARARQLKTLCRRVIVGPPARQEIRDLAGQAPPELLGLVERAFSRGVALAFQYVGRAGLVSRRVVEPHGLLVHPPLWYLLSRDIDRGAPRVFRMDRIARPRLVESRTFRPDEHFVRAQIPRDGRWQPLIAFEERD